jgi:hypothetical protein
VNKDTSGLHKNFYENMEEMQKRLLNTVVTYEGEPVRIVAITNHKPDGIFRLYLWPVHVTETKMYPGQIDGYRHGSAEQGAYIDGFMEQHKLASPIMRKMANSPAFNKFRPFPLGMMNKDGRALYLERTPERRTYQGLVASMVQASVASVAPMKPDEAPYNRPRVNLTGPEFVDCVKGAHPTAMECLKNLLDKTVENSSVAFDRNFAFVRGPLDTLFLQYKTDVVGFVPATDRPQVELGAKFKHLKEVVEESKHFEAVKVRI